MDLFTEGLKYSDLLVKFVRGNRNAMALYVDDLPDKLYLYSKKEYYDNVEDFSRDILLSEYQERFSRIMRLYQNNVEKIIPIDKNVIKLLKNHLIPNIIKNAIPQERQQSWLVKLLLKNVGKSDEQKVNINVLWVNSFLGNNIYELAQELEQVISKECTYNIIGIDPLNESVQISKKGVYPSNLFSFDYPYKNLFDKKGDSYEIQDKRSNNIKFQHTDILSENPGFLKETFDFIILYRARFCYSLSLLHKMIEKCIYLLKPGGVIIPYINNIEYANDYPTLDTLSVGGHFYYKRNNAIIINKSSPVISEIDESIDNLIIFATAQLLNKNYNKVLEYTHHILNRQVDHRQAIILRSMALIGKGDLNGSVHNLKQALILNSIDFEVYLLNSYIDYKNKKYKEAQENLQQAITHFNFNRMYKVISQTSEEEKLFLKRCEDINELINLKIQIERDYLLDENGEKDEKGKIVHDFDRKNEIGEKIAELKEKKSNGGLQILEAMYQESEPKYTPKDEDRYGEADFQKTKQTNVRLNSVNTLNNDSLNSGLNTKKEDNEEKEYDKNKIKERTNVASNDSKKEIENKQNISDKHPVNELKKAFLIPVKPEPVIIQREPIIRENKKEEPIILQERVKETVIEEQIPDELLVSDSKKPMFSENESKNMGSSLSVDRIKKISPMSYEVVPEEISYEHIGSDPFKLKSNPIPQKRNTDNNIMEIPLDYQDISRTLMKSEKNKPALKRESSHVNKNEYSSIVEEALVNLKSDFTDFTKLNDFSLQKNSPVKEKSKKEKEIKPKLEKQESQNNEYASIVEEALINLQDFSSLGDQ